MIPASATSARRALSFSARLAAKRIELAVGASMGRPPVVTYACWRTASTSCHRAVRASGRWPAVKAHALHPDERFRSYCTSFRGSQAFERRHVGDWAVRRGIIERRGEALWIVMVRDPLAVAASIAAQEQHMIESWSRSAGGGAAPGRSEALARTAPVDLLDRWFELDVRPSLGWSPLDTPFDCERGWSESPCEFGRVLTMRADVSDQAKSEALTRFLRRKVSVRPLNSASSNGRGDQVFELASHMRQLSEVVERVRATLVAKHFWLPKQLEQLHLSMGRVAP
jgi:hypothetical protein